MKIKVTLEIDGHQHTHSCTAVQSADAGQLLANVVHDFNERVAKLPHHPEVEPPKKAKPNPKERRG